MQAPQTSGRRAGTCVTGGGVNGLAPPQARFELNGKDRMKTLKNKLFDLCAMSLDAGVCRAQVLAASGLASSKQPPSAVVQPVVQDLHSIGVPTPQVHF